MTQEEFETMLRQAVLNKEIDLEISITNMGHPNCKLLKVDLMICGTLISATDTFCVETT